MKHCPNPECPGLENSGIISEFNDTSNVCADCGVELKIGPAPDKLPSEETPQPDMELVSVLKLTSESEIVIAESLLRDAEIPYLARGEQIQDLFGMGRLVAVNPILEPVEFLVAARDEIAAREILAEIGD